MQTPVYRILFTRQYIYGVPATLAVILFVCTTLIGIQIDHLIIAMVVVYPSMHMTIWLTLEEHPYAIDNIIIGIRCWFRNKKNKQMGGVYYSPIDFN
jgi:type IV secretory pathway VirB3-like protein